MTVSQNIKKVVGLSLFSLALLLPLFSGASTTLEERLKPVGETCMAGDPCAAAVAAAGGGEPRSGEVVYNTKCSACHATGAAGAPKYGDAAAWAPRLEERGIEGLYTHAIDGFNGMPAKGLCMDCSDDEIKVAVDYMVDHSK